MFRSAIDSYRIMTSDASSQRNPSREQTDVRLAQLESFGGPMPSEAYWAATAASSPHCIYGSSSLADGQVARDAAGHPPRAPLAPPGVIHSPRLSGPSLP
jgi:hypothetical protein